MAMVDNSFVSTSFHDGVVVASIKVPRITEHESAAILEDLTRVGQSYGWKLALDMSSVLLLASVGISMLLTLRKSASASKGAVALFSVSDDLLAMLKVTKLHTLFRVAPDRGSAIKAIG